MTGVTNPKERDDAIGKLCGPLIALSRYKQSAPVGAGPAGWGFPTGPALGRSAADRAAVVLGDHEAGRTRPATVRASWPGAVFCRIGRIVSWIGGAGQVGRFTGVLYPDKHGTLVRRHRDSGDLALPRSYQKPTNLSSGGVVAKHLVVADSCIVTIGRKSGGVIPRALHARCRYVCFYP